MARAWLTSRSMGAILVATLLFAAQLLTASHFHQLESGSHQDGSLHACAICLVKSSVNEDTGPLPSAIGVLAPLAHRYIGVVYFSDALPSSVEPSDNWVRGPPALA